MICQGPEFEGNQEPALTGRRSRLTTHSAGVRRHPLAPACCCPVLTPRSRTGVAFRSFVLVPKRSRSSLGDALVRGRGTGLLRAPNEARVESTTVATRFPTRRIPLRCSLSPVVGTWSSVKTPRRYCEHSEPEGVLREAEDPSSWQTTRSAEEDTSEPSRLAFRPLDGRTDSDLRSRSGKLPHDMATSGSIPCPSSGSSASPTLKANTSVSPLSHRATLSTQSQCLLMSRFRRGHRGQNQSQVSLLEQAQGERAVDTEFQQAFVEWHCRNRRTAAFRDEGQTPMCCLRSRTLNTSAESMSCTPYVPTNRCTDSLSERHRIYPRVLRAMPNSRRRRAGCRGGGACVASGCRASRGAGSGGSG